MTTTSDLRADLGPDVRTHLPRPGWPPLFIEPAGGALADRAAFLGWLEEYRPVLDGLIVEYGGIVLRRFPVVTTEDFDAVIDRFPLYEAGYVGGTSPRATLGTKALQSTALSADFPIPLHQEMAYSPNYPPRIIFFSRVIPEEAGQTPIADMRRVTDGLSDDLVARLEKLGIAAVRNNGNGDHLEKGWLDADYVPWFTSFATDNRAELEEICRRTNREFIWNADGSLTTIARYPAFVTHPVTGRKIYRANLQAPPSPFVDRSPEGDEMRTYQAVPTGNYLGDGTPLSRAEWEHLNDLIRAARVEWPWTAGDVMILDNLQVAHGRNPFRGDRDTQVALLA